MSFNKNKKKFVSFLAVGLFMVTGTYNAVVINSESYLTDVKFVKRLDELYGINKPARQVATSIAWQKLTPAVQAPIQPTIQRQQAAPSQSNEVASSSEPAPTSASVQEELSLNLTEVINPKKYQKGLTASDFSGALQTNNGVIEALNVSLPNDEGVSISFSEMAGNVFEYDLDGNLYSGMMYQVDSNAYMVTLTNGPLEGTRMRFTPEAQVEQVQPDMPSADMPSTEVAEAGVETGTFGQEPEVNAQQINVDALSENDQMLQQQALEAQGYNLSGNL